MMCLGWYNKTTCNVRPPVDVATGQAVVTAPGSVITPACPSSTWFFLAAGAILLGGMFKK